MQTGKREYQVKESDDGKRLDLFLKESLADHSRNRIKKIIDSGGVYVNKKRTQFASHLLKVNDYVELYEDETSDARRKLTKSDIIFEDEDILVINKPANIPTQASYSNIKGTILELAENYYSERGIKQYLRLIHRLDKGTTGVLLLAKTPYANEALTEQFRKNEIEKEYFALVSGIPKEKTGAIESFISKVNGSSVKYTNVKSGGKRAVTRYSLEKELKGHSLIRLNPKTGRTHQIRVHLSGLGHPILGDELYGGKTRLSVKNGEIMRDINMARVMLHAGSVKFTHPKSGKIIRLRARLPEDMERIIDLL